MTRRNLTGNWYLKKRRWRTDVMVEVELEEWSDPTYGNGGGSYDPKVTVYQKAEDKDLIELNIRML